ncbi:hypothetical protein GGR52DRAFT_80914 [Hypoxylon sp. FL1284]|nr:hypothetical protein GGR52DRAFT_80914 [Hypoxylon sp. FL1284]
MAREKYDEEKASSVGGNDHAQLLYRSLEQYNREQKRTRRPSVLLGALISLFLSSAGGISLAVILMLQPVEIQAACIARDLILFAASLTLLYICLHIRGARKDYRRRGPGPPQIYGEYLHASALIVERLGIVVWVAALVATVVMIIKAVPLPGFAGITPYLNLATCIGAIPSFIIISATIESNPTPFATTGLSSSSFLTCRVSEFGDDLSAESSVSRRASLHRKESKSDSVMTVPTAEIFKLGGAQSPPKAQEPLKIVVKELPDDRTELMANSPTGPSHALPNIMSAMPRSPVPPVPKLPPSLSIPPPKAAYIPGGWRNEWNHVAEQVGVSKMPDGPAHDPRPSGHAGEFSYSSSAHSSESGGYSFSSSSTQTAPPPNVTGTGAANHRRQHRATPSTSIASTAQRSRLSTVRYAAQPEIAVRQEIRVVRNPNFVPPPGSRDRSAEREAGIKAPEPVALATGGKTPSPPPLRRQPSNFSRPLPPSRGSEADSGIAMRWGGADEHEGYRV